MRLQDFIPLREFHIEHECKLDDINIQVRNRIELNLLGYESKVHRKFGTRPSLIHHHLVYKEWELQMQWMTAFPGQRVMSQK